MPEIGKNLIIAGLLLALFGTIIYLGEQTGLGRLPGDFIFRNKHFTIYFPLATSLLFSLLLSVVWILLRR